MKVVVHEEKFVRSTNPIKSIDISYKDQSFAIFPTADGTLCIMASGKIKVLPRNANAIFIETDRKKDA